MELQRQQQIELRRPCLCSFTPRSMVRHSHTHQYTRTHIFLLSFLLLLLSRHVDFPPYSQKKLILLQTHERSCPNLRRVAPVPPPLGTTLPAVSNAATATSCVPSETVIPAKINDATTTKTDNKMMKDEGEKIVKKTFMKYTQIVYKVETANISLR